MICHAIIGKNPLKERIMTVDVTAKFIAPLLEFSSKKLLFSLLQVSTCTSYMYVYIVLCNIITQCICTILNDIIDSMCPMYMCVYILDIV